MSNVSKKMESIEESMVNIMGCLETLENSLFFAEERKDKDLTKPCAKCVELIMVMVDGCINSIEEARLELEG